MSKLQNLIERLCPEGVEFKKLGEIGKFTRGNGLQKKDFFENGFPCIHYGQIYTRYGLFTDKTISYCSPDLAKTLIKAKRGDMVIACTSENVEDVCKAVVWLGEGEIVTGGHACVFSHNQDPKYVAYFFRSEQFFLQKKRYAKGVKVIDIKVGDLEKIEIPVPPLEVQSKIVEILDNFTELEAKLEAELEARRKQYEYYRNKLLTFDKVGGVRFEKLEDVFELRNGYTPSKNNSAFWDNGTIPWFRMEDIRENGRILSDAIQHITPSAVKGKGLFESGSFIMATTATIGEHAMLIVDSLANQRFTNLKIRKSLASQLTSKYCFHYMYILGEWCKQNVNAGGFASVDMGKFKNYMFPIPPLAEQERIVSILDRFEALTTDLQSGLPAEIAARRKQYEYYREKLLTFKRKTA